MTVLLENESNLELGLDYEKIALEIMKRTLDYIQCPYECVVNILLTDNKNIKKMNQKMRGINMPTDVLSFPGIFFEKEGDFSIVEHDIASYFDSESGELLLGDIMISLEKVKTQATEYNHSIKREYAFLLAHSFLHLSGFDHENDDERERMEMLQEEILQSLLYTRDMN